MFTLNEEDLKRIVIKGLENELRSVMMSSYGVGPKVKKMAEDAIANNQQLLSDTLQTAFLAALDSPEFAEMTRKAMLDAMKGKFTGVFDGVMRAAGKKAAQEQLLATTLASKMAEPTGTVPAFPHELPRFRMEYPDGRYSVLVGKYGVLAEVSEDEATQIVALPKGAGFFTDQQGRVWARTY